MAKSKKKTRRKRALTSISKSPSSLPLFDNESPLIDRATVLWKSGNREEALKFHLEAIRQEPENIRAYITAARAFGSVFQLDTVERIFAKLLKRAPDHPGVHHYIGETYRQLNYPDKAVAAYEKAAVLPEVLPGTWMELADAYERSHRLEEAWELIRRTEAAGLDLPLVYLAKARLQRRLGETQSAETTLRDFIAAQPTNSRWACQAWGELALMHDRAGDFEQAIEAIQNCKAIQRPGAVEFEKKSAADLSRMKQLVSSIRAENFSKWSKQAADFPPTRVALLTGFPRSGTTLLEQILDSHPDLVSNEERDYLGTCVFPVVLANSPRAETVLESFQSMTLSQVKCRRGEYLRIMSMLLNAPIGGRMHLDKNPAYNLTIPLFLRLFPEGRLVLAIRDPRDVVLSCYLRYLPLNTISSCFNTLEKTAKRYAVDMNAWLTFRNMIPGPWCQVRYEDTVANMEVEAKKTFQMLGMKWDASVLYYRDRLSKEKKVSSPTYEAVTQPIYTHAINRWKHYEKHLEPTFEILQPFIDEFGYD